MKMMKFVLDGCDISITAEAPEDITLKQLLAQTDRIVPDWCTCGIYSDKYHDMDPEVRITYDDIEIISNMACCTLLPKGQKRYES